MVPWLQKYSTGAQAEYTTFLVLLVIFAIGLFLYSGDNVGIVLLKINLSVRME